ncbi:MAG: DUF3108 domain-containing protein [Nitrospina sp.]|jgi:hypothetical protein|nr:DUF3108 domain-containing protein [Nitrospina sp.]MBT3510209.1 DUF3108 domain-containing protein [Nitrospina sp.]MBT3876823.1 DUF3108 domain-containing protein [Nitrospina sp.]MBT4048179.1 DUF3108 domain-containing protein [Nitrospina sp.]MBT4556865.1 DUF3108 domain-containing protein [Nitrospina sp.]
MSSKPSNLLNFLIIVAISVSMPGIASTTHALEEKLAKPITLGEYKGFYPEGKITRFSGESLYYDISFLWFKNAASAKVSFFEEHGKYFSVLEASTKGFVGFFTSYRKHFYKTEFEIIDNGKKLRPRTFLRQVIIGDQVEGTQHRFDYAKRLHTWEKHLNGEKVKTDQEEIPSESAFNDILTSFYNVRNSIYGKLKKGQKFKIKTIPEKGHDEISVHIWSEKAQEKFRIEEAREPGEELLINIVVPKEIFKSETGELMVWTSKHYVPVETIVKDYILLGDLHARFTHREANH